jgi:hypothetical protein
LIEWSLGNSDLALLAPALFCKPNEAVALKQPNIRLNVLEVSLYGFGQFIDGLGLLCADRLQKSTVLSGQKIARRLKAGEMHPFALP